MKVLAYLGGAVLLFAVEFALVWYCTSPDVWHAGEHTADCDGSGSCGCYEKLVADAKEKELTYAMHK